MENRENGHDGPKVEEVPGVGIAGYTQDDDPIALMGGGFSQDDALVSYRLEHEVNEEFRQYAQSDIDRLMGTFDAWLADLQATFSNRVGAKLVAYAVREILRVWEKAANNGADRFKESSPSTGVQQIPTLVGGESSLTSAAESRDDESDGVGEAADKSPAQQATADPTEQVRTEEREDSKVLSWAARASEVSLYGNQSPEEQSAGIPSGANGAGHETDPNADSGICQGTVKVRVEAGASVQRVARFLRELRREQEILMQQMVSDRSDGTHIWLGLRKPLPLQEILLQMESVSRVEWSAWLEEDTNQPSFDVQLVATHDN